MKLKDAATVKTDYPEADFWLVRRGSEDSVGQVTREYSPYHIGIKVHRTEILLPDYLYYVMMHLHSIGAWKVRARGTLSLVHITVSDVKNIELSPS